MVKAAELAREPITGRICGSWLAESLTRAPRLSLVAFSLRKGIIFDAGHQPVLRAMHHVGDAANDIGKSRVCGSST
jgi:hypothetical protein